MVDTFSTVWNYLFFDFLLQKMILRYDKKDGANVNSAFDNNAGEKMIVV